MGPTSVEKRVRLIGTYHPDSDVSPEIVAEVAGHATQRNGSKVRLQLTLDGLEIKHATGMLFKSRDKGLFKNQRMYVPFDHINNFYVCIPNVKYPCLLCSVFNEGIDSSTRTNKLIAFLCSMGSDAMEFLDVFVEIKHLKSLPEHPIDNSNLPIRREKTNSVGSRSSSGRLQGHERAALEQHNGGTRVQYVSQSSTAEQNQNSNASSSHRPNGDAASLNRPNGDASSSHKSNDNAKENVNSEHVYAFVNKNKSKKKTAPQYGSHGDLKKSAAQHDAHYKSRKTSSHHEMENGYGKSTHHNGMYYESKKAGSKHDAKHDSRKSTSQDSSNQDVRKSTSTHYDSSSDLRITAHQHESNNNLLKVSATNSVAHDLPNGISSEKTSNRDTVSSTSEVGLHHNLSADFPDNGIQASDKIDIRGKIEYLTEEIEQLKNMLDKDEPGKHDNISKPHPHQSQHRHAEQHVSHAQSNIDISDRMANHLIHSPRAQGQVSYTHNYTLPRTSGGQSSKTADSRRSDFVDGKARLVIGDGRVFSHAKRVDPVAAGPIYISSNPAFSRQTGLTRHSSLKYDNHPHNPGTGVKPVEHIRSSQPVSPVLASISETMYAPSQPGMAAGQSVTLTRPQSASHSNVHMESYDSSKGTASPRSVKFENNFPTYKKGNPRPKSMTHYDTVAKPIEQVYSRNVYPSVHMSRPSVIYTTRPHMTSPPTVPPPSYHDAYRYTVSSAPAHAVAAHGYNYREHEPKPS